METPILIICLSLFALVLYFAWRSLKAEQEAFFANHKYLHSLEYQNWIRQLQEVSDVSDNRARIQRRRHQKQSQQIKQNSDQVQQALILAAGGRKEPFPVQNVFDPRARKEDRYIANLPKKRILGVETPAETAPPENPDNPA